MGCDHRIPEWLEFRDLRDHLVLIHCHGQGHLPLDQPFGKQNQIFGFTSSLAFWNTGDNFLRPVLLEGKNPSHLSIPYVFPGTPLTLMWFPQPAGMFLLHLTKEKRLFSYRFVSWFSFYSAVRQVGEQLQQRKSIHIIEKKGEEEEWECPCLLEWGVGLFQFYQASSLWFL